MSMVNYSFILNKESDDRCEEKQSVYFRLTIFHLQKLYRINYLLTGYFLFIQVIFEPCLFFRTQVWSQFIQIRNLGIKFYFVCGLFNFIITSISSLKQPPRLQQHRLDLEIQNMDIYNQLEQKARSNYIQPDLNATMRQVHLQQKNEQLYKDTILHVFEYGLATRNYEENLKIGLWFAEICNLDPHYSHLFPSFKASFCSAAIQNIFHNGAKLEHLATLAARLIQFDDVAGIIRDLKQLSGESNENTKKILNALDFFNEVIVWQMERKKIYLRSRRYQTLKMIKNILKEFKKMPELNQEKFLGQKIKLLHSIVLYLISQYPQKSKNVPEQIQILKASIIEELTIYDRIQLDRENQDVFLDLLADTIEFFGIYDQPKLQTIVTKFKHKTENISYLGFFTIFAENLTKSTTKNIKLTIEHIVESSLSKILEVEFKTFSQLYNVLKAKSDIVIELNKISLLNLTKYLQKCLQKANNNFQQMFFMSLIIIYNPTVRSEVTDRLNPSQHQIFYHNKQHKQYYQMIEYFASSDLQATDYIQDPESKDALVWGLLALRNSIKVNYYFLSENDYVFNIYTNLVRLMLSNICSKQCEELASELLHKNQSSAYKWKQKINYSSIIAWSHQNLQFIYPQALQSFSNLLTNHVRVFKKEPFQNLDVFRQICHLGTKIIREITFEQQQMLIRYIQLIYNMLRTTLPTHNINLVKSENIYPAAEALISLIQICPNNALFPIYIDFLFTFRQSNILHELFADTRINNHQILNNMDSLTYRKYENMSYIATRLDLSQDEVELYWHKINLGIDQRDQDLGLYFLQTYRHFLNNFKKQIQMHPDSATSYCLFYRNQVMQCNVALNSIYKTIQEQILVSSLQNLLEISVSLNLNLTIILTEIQKYDQMKVAADDRLVRLCQDISKWLKIMEKLFNEQLKWEQKSTTASVWRVSYITLIVVACLSCQLSLKSDLKINFSYEMMRAKLEWATNKMRQIDEQQVQKFNLVFTQLFLFQLQGKAIERV